MVITVWILCALATVTSAGSCENRCEAALDTSEPCQCDSDCVAYDDCCDDYHVQCVTGSCEDRCEAALDTSEPCQCDSDCVTYGDCCDDYHVQCVTGSCEDRCGAAPDFSEPCQCNSPCVTYGDCCDDYHVQCVTGTCSGRCFTAVDQSKPCQCNTACTSYGDCCSDYTQICQGESEGESLSSVMSQIWNMDTNRLTNEDHTVNYQEKVNSDNTGDSASKPFFSYVNNNIFNSKQTFSRFLPLLDNYNPNIGQSESLTSAEWTEIENFLDAALATSVMQKAYSYLRAEGKTTSESDFRDLVKELWFNLYPRSSSGPIDSSGFEHVMVGEIKNGVSGFHSWIQFYQEEKEGRVDYMGYVSISDPEIVGAQFTWNGYRKSKGSFFVGTSPEFDLAVYSICAVMHPNSVCSFTMNGHNIRIQTWDVNHKSGLQVASAYPL